jgi:tetratricopeptide (TPR) repeat protein
MKKKSKTAVILAGIINITKGSYKTMLFKFITILLPFIILILIEVILRASGYGNNMRLFKNYEPDKRYLIMNDAVSQKYFTKTENATIGFDEIFRKKKSTETFRIFVLGESTAQGFPYTYNVSFHRWLKYRLMHTFPEINFEMINLALTAVNSYTVFDFAKEIIKYKPDAVLIYVGHNEYYGALGVGSTSKLGNHVHLVRVLMNLRQLRFVQLIHNTVNKVSMITSGKSSITDLGLMSRMAADQYIPYGSKQYQRGIKQFETNMNDVCRILAGKKIPVIISNLVSNEKDLKPFISDTGNNNQSAAYQYELAEKSYQRGDFKKARELYVRAKDLDLLRFRAPEEFNSIIAKLPHKFSGVFIANTKSLFEKYSPHGIIGRETILEHVHPNLFGYALLSESFYQTIRQYGIIDFQDEQEISFKQLLEKMPLSAVDSLKGVYLFRKMLMSWPFNINMKFNIPETDDSDQKYSVEGMLAEYVASGDMQWYNAVVLLARHYEETKNLRGAFRLSESMVLEFPYEVNAYINCAKAGLRIGDKKEGAFYFVKAFQLKPDTTIAKNISQLLMENDQPEQALPYLNYLIEQNVSASMHLPSLEIVRQIIEMKSKLPEDSSNVLLLNQIANAYWYIKNKEAGLKYANKSLSLDPGNKNTLEIMSEFKALPE